MESSEISGNSANDDQNREEIKLVVPADQYRAFQRCVWILVHETGRSQLDVMQEVVEDFLMKHEC